MTNDQDNFNLYPDEIYNTQFSAWGAVRDFLFNMQCILERSEVLSTGFASNAEVFCKFYRILLEMDIRAPQLMELLRKRFPEYKESLSNYLETGRTEKKEDD